MKEVIVGLESEKQRKCSIVFRAVFQPRKDRIRIHQNRLVNIRTLLILTLYVLTSRPTVTLTATTSTMITNTAANVIEKSTFKGILNTIIQKKVIVLCTDSHIFLSDQIPTNLK